ncbi:MAG: restriction endonuclease subunit S [Flavisolibacter sp.]
MPNENKPGYKNTQLGWIPEEWEINRLGKLMKLISGLHLGPSEYNKSGKGTPYFTGPTDYTNCFNELTKWTNKKGALAKANDVLITVKGSGVGSMHYLSLPQVAIGRQIMAIRDDENSCTSFIYHYLLQKEYQFRELAKGNMIPGLTRHDILTLEIKTPSLPERKKIAAILSIWDEAITKTQQLIAQLQQRNKGLMQQLLTGKKRLKGFEKTKWNKINADAIFKSVSIKNNSNEQLLSATQDKGIIPRDMLSGRVTMPSGETKSYKLVEPGNFIISLRSFQGGLEYSEYRGIVSPAYTVLKPVKCIDDDFYKYYFKSYDFIGHLAVAVIGIRDGKQISFDDFCVLRLPYPPLEEQKQIAAILSQADNEVKLYEQQLTILQQQKKGLMKKLLTGEIRVKIDN